MVCSLELYIKNVNKNENTFNQAVVHLLIFIFNIISACNTSTQQQQPVG